MAGAGYKLFNTGDVLTAAQVNTYLQEQTVMVFASAAARTTALTGVVAEGMISYLTDTDVVQYYNGTTWTTINTDQTPLTTKGDLFTFSTQDARLAVGNNGETLVADSSTSTGLRYNPQNALANPVINGGFDIWQRGTTFANPANSYTADRWLGSTATAGTITRQLVSDPTNLPNIQYALRYARTAGSTSTSSLSFAQSFETVNSIPFAGKTITLSFYARAGANYSAASSALAAQLRTGTGTDQNVFTVGYTGSVTAIAGTATLTTTWQRFAFNATLATDTTEIGLTFIGTPTGTAGAADYYEITGVQIDLGTYTSSTAPTFRRSGGTLAGELAACRRYLPAITGGAGTAAYSLNGYAYNTNQTLYNFYFDVPARVAPTGITVSGTHQAYVGNTGTSVTPTFSCASVNTAQVLVTSGLTITTGAGSRLESLSTGATILFTGCEL